MQIERAHRQFENPDGDMRAVRFDKPKDVLQIRVGRHTYDVRFADGGLVIEIPTSGIVRVTTGSLMRPNTLEERT